MREFPARGARAALVRPRTRLVGAMAVVLAIGVLPLCGGAVLLQRNHAESRAGDALDRALSARADEQATTLENYFARARSIDLLSAQNPSFLAFSTLPGPVDTKIRVGGPALRQVNNALTYLERLYPGSIGEACFIDLSGREMARAVRGRSAPAGTLSLDESKNPFFAPTFALRLGQVYQARPYVSPDTGEWVVSNSTLLPTADGSKRAFVHFEVTIESFRKAAARHQRFDVAVIDARTGAVVFNSRVPQRKGAPLGRPGDRRLASVTGQGKAAGILDLGGRRSAYKRLRPTVGNANDWYVVASSAPAAAPSLTFNVVPFAAIAAVLLLFAFALARRWVRIHARIDEERRQSEEELLEREERYRELFENANDAIATLDLDGHVTSANKALEVMSGYEREELVGMRIGELLDAPAEPAGTLNSAIERGSTHEAEMVARDGRTTSLEVGFRPIEKDHALVGTQLIARDVTERRQLEEQLRQSQKMEAVGQLAGGVAHDFNNLLTAIVCYTQLALMRAGSDAVLDQHLREVDRAADRAAGLTGQLLAFSRKQMLQPRVFDLNLVVNDIRKMLERMIGEDVELVAVLDTALAPIEADQGQIEQVIVNLVLNARDAMPRGGTLTIQTANVRGNGGPPKVVLTVTDTGVGMDAATRDKVFEPFFTTKEPGKGTGLGLSTVYGIVQQSGGHLTIETEPGRGSAFSVSLRAAAGREAEVSGSVTAAESPTGSETVLLVEDEHVVRRLASEILVTHGYNVLEAEGGDEALGICRSGAGPIHLLLTDVVMPKLSGPELAQRVLLLEPEARLLYMSGYADDATLPHRVVAEGTPFLQKPFAPAALARKVREVL
ncbi:MAG: two-component system, cell cycle sensor histidine kinase and response regulator CckA, partial [Gaiellaceae bacterium]|nr:two-component system, cell cycle sensor histidine kinase and response regulator CckA [Gaiellaceae bacterium]